MAKQEVRRGRKFVEYHDPDTQPEGTFTQEISGADVSYQDEHGNWLAADENWQADGLDGFILKNDKLNHKVRFDSIGAWRWYPRRNVNTEYITFGVPQYRNGNKWSNFSFSGWSVEGKTITLNTRRGVTILVHNRWNGIKIDWVLASSSAPSRMRYPVSLTGITYVDGIIYGADGTRLGQLTPTTATDANGAELACSGSYANGYVEFQADVTGASFPVTIDPDFSVQPDETSGVDTKLKQTSPTTNYGTSNLIEISSWTPASDKQSSLIKFDYSSIPSGSTVIAGTITLIRNLSYGTNSGSAYRLLVDWVEGQATWNIRKTGTNWGTAGANGSGTDRCASATSTVTLAATTTFNLASDIQLFIDGTSNYGWVLIASDTPNCYAEFHSSSATTASNRPSSSVTYTSGATGALRRTNMNAQMSNLTGGMHG